MKKYIAEFIGTYWLVLGGCGSAVIAASFPNVGIGLLGVSLAFGLTLLLPISLIFRHNREHIGHFFLEIKTVPFPVTSEGVAGILIL